MAVPVRKEERGRKASGLSEGYADSFCSRDAFWF